MTQGVDIYTARGIEKIRNAAGTGNKVKIKYIALGDALGAAYAPSASQNSLRRERLRTEIERHYPVGKNAWHVTASFPPEATQITVREMGFFDEDGDLIAMWAGTDVGTSRQTGAIEYLINHVIAFDGISDGVVIIAAPLDPYIDQAVLNLRTNALIFDRQNAQAEKLRALGRVT